MTAWADKDEQTYSAREHVYRVLQGLHPTDKAEAYIEVGRAATAEGKRLQERNEEHGVPEHEGDQS